ncbi:MAG: hypothetical protein ABSF72_03450 [Candidatus Sulfotelmatobacter sp.]|jgi:hypothetical protein
MRISFYFVLVCTLAVLSSQGIAFCQDTNFVTGPQYLMNYGSPLLARSISTPSLSLAGPPVEVGASDATGVLNAGASDQNVLPPSPDAMPKIDLFPIFYGEPPVSENGEISFSYPLQPSSPAAEIPPSISDNGVSQITTVQALHERGYGLTVAEAAAEAKARIQHANHIYTNADAARLHGGN